MKVTENEMRGLLTGKCVPGDMLVNEELPEYLVRKFSDLQQKLDAVLAENVALKLGAEKCYDDITAIHNSYGWNVSEDGESETAVIDLDGAQFVIQETLLDIETPATDAILNAVRSEGIQLAINNLKALDASPFAIHSLECKLYELRASKDADQ